MRVERELSTHAWRSNRLVARCAILRKLDLPLHRSLRDLTLFSRPLALQQLCMASMRLLWLECLNVRANVAMASNTVYLNFCSRRTPRLHPETASKPTRVIF